MPSNVAAPAVKQRIPYFDNVKFVLIVLVVLGHSLKLGPTDVFSSARAASVFIYSFHMPLFIFLTGLMLNRQKMTAEKTLTNVALFTGYGYLAKLLRAVVPYIFTGTFEFEAFSEGGLPWYMFVLAAFYGLAWLLRGCNFVLVGVVSLVLALAAGYEPAIDEFLCLSRVIVFFPFFWLGHALSPKEVASFFARPPVRVACVFVAVAFALLCATHADEFYLYRSLFLGRHGYAGVDVPNCTWVNRLLAYTMSLVMGCAVMGIVPQGYLPVASKLGGRTLWVYLLHYEVLDVLRYATNFPDWLVSGPEWRWLVLIPGSFVLACILSLPLPVNPFAKLRKD